MNAKTIKLRKEIKLAGYKRNQVSLREEKSSLNWSYTITIKDTSINVDDLIEIAKKNESFQRDSATGEILGGGNVYIAIQNEYGILY